MPNNAPEHNPLTFATTDELIAELGRRHDCFIAAWESSLNKHQIQYGCKFIGSRTYALGLLERAAYSILNGLDRKEDDDLKTDDEDFETKEFDGDDE